ncbi:MAG: hypothetical protein EPN76_08305 [Burkholderiaceae bacterium]|nr:MAG: hypothetical protein EPN76_08305 [Burkholderiaceae bacterium]TAM08908.1 MAG: hypothetical protein EPN67_02020 [Pusillimonas sp.]
MKLSAGSVGWRAREVREWLAELPQHTTKL